MLPRVSSAEIGKVLAEDESTMLTSPETPSPSNEASTGISILITGGTGFLGSFIVNAVLEQHPEWAITVLDLKLPTNFHPKVTYEVGDVTNATALRAVIDKISPNVIIHTAGLVPELAGRYSRQQQKQVFHVNVDGTRNMLAAAKAADTRAFVWTGSCTAVTDDMRYQYANVDERWPTSAHSLIYGESKVCFITSLDWKQGLLANEPRRLQLKLWCSQLMRRHSQLVHFGRRSCSVQEIINSSHQSTRA